MQRVRFRQYRQQVERSGLDSDGTPYLALLFAYSSVDVDGVQAYHDMATHDVEDGTGGLDASIQFEQDRPEVRKGGPSK